MLIEAEPCSARPEVRAGDNCRAPLQQVRRQRRTIVVLIAISCDDDGIIFKNMKVERQRAHDYGLQNGYVECKYVVDPCCRGRPLCLPYFGQSRGLPLPIFETDARA
jgi:hypothetical protein